MRRISLKDENNSTKFLEIYSPSNELTDTFYSNSKKGNVINVRLNSTGLLLQRNTSDGKTKDHLIQICDIVGGRCVWIPKSNRFGNAGTCGACSPSSTEKKSNENEDAYLYVFAYIIKKNIRNSLRRERTVITLRFRSFDSHEDNMREAEKWYKVLKTHKNSHFLFCNLRTSDSFNETGSLGIAKRLLIFLNPKSGSGKARELFHQQVVPILNEAEVSYDLHITKYRQYAYDFVRLKNLSVWNGIVATGGDGLFHEILNGLFKRNDWNSIVKNIALGIVPCGSGNGLARSIAHCFQEPYEPKPIIGAALNLVGGHYSIMDIVEIEMQNKIIYSFLSVGWGLISDIDIESERLRPLGYQRFTIWTFHRLLNLRTYRGRLSYLLKENETTNKNVTILNNLQHSVSCNTFPLVSELKRMHISNVSDTEFEDVISLETVANQSHRSRCNSLLSSESRISTYYSIAESVYHSVSGSSHCNEIKNEVSNIVECKFQPLSQKEPNSLPSLEESLPESWLVEDGEFVMVHAVYQSHLGSDCYFSPESRLNDGTIYLVIIRGGISRSQLFNFLINMSSGSHLPTKNTDYIRVERVVAFRLEPNENNGILTVDGERVECCSLQARIYSGAINVMVPKNNAFTD